MTISLEFITEQLNYSIQERLHYATKTGWAKASITGTSYTHTDYFHTRTTACVDLINRQRIYLIKKSVLLCEWCY